MVEFMKLWVKYFLYVYITHYVYKMYVWYTIDAFIIILSCIVWMIFQCYCFTRLLGFICVFVCFYVVLFVLTCFVCSLVSFMLIGLLISHRHLSILTFIHPIIHPSMCPVRQPFILYPFMCSFTLYAQSFMFYPCGGVPRMQFKWKPPPGGSPGLSKVPSF